jgi:acyl transferase domain-containing protein/acyl-CoA synthetase (AMP-forming)/AMP-acid ligase II/acyl carrier protein
VKRTREAVPAPTKCSNLVDLLCWRAGLQAQQVAYKFLPDGEAGTEEVLCYAELDRRARAIAVQVARMGLAGERVLLLFPPGLDYIASFFGCLYAGAVAVPAYPPRLNRPVPRLQAIVADAQAMAALASPGILANLEQRFAHTPDLALLRWLTPQPEWDQEADQWRRPDLDSRTLAFLQYTSGSTAAPKGVMVSHGNLMSNSGQMRRHFEYADESGAVIWLPPYHDMGLIGGVLQPLYGDFPATILPPVAFLQRPVRWLDTISREQASISGAPNFAYDLCARTITPEQLERLDLSRWTLAFCGSEPVRADTLERFATRFAPAGFRASALYPCYGLAEATLLVAGGRRTEPPVVRTEGMARPLVSCGTSVHGQRLVIADPETLATCPPDRVGEIWLSGPNIARGYWNRPEESARAFNAFLADSGEGPFLRTGDLGFESGGDLLVTGRIKDLIIIRGRNHYPQDIEATVERSHPSLRPGNGAAFSVEIGGEEKLVVAYEVERRERNPDAAAIAKEVRRAIAEEHDLELHALVLLKVLGIPKTSSGKVQRQACRRAFLEDTLQVTGRWTAGESRPDRAQTPEIPEIPEIKAWLVERISEMLGIDPREVDPRRPFSEYGLDSLKSVEITRDLEDRLGRKVSPTLAWDYPTVEAAARHLAGVAGMAEVESPAPRSCPAAEPVAIVGIGCRLPGADGPEAFWRLLHDGVDAVSEVQPDRWDTGALYDPVRTPGKMSTRWGGFLDRVDLFDPQFFGLSVREAIQMDPQQRLLLEVAWEALEHAGLAPEELAGSSAGVFVGISGSDYGHLLMESPGLLDAYAGTGNALSIAANRLSYVLGLEGPSLAVDTACSSSLVAIHLACQSLRAGESSLAIAGGVNLILSPGLTVALSQAEMMSPDGRCKAFDASASGYVRGEGCGLVILKRLSDALRDGDRVLALVRGSAMNQDGRSNGLTAPSGLAQQAVIRRALSAAGVEPAEVAYVETHGTGTLLGDPIEAGALAAVLGQGRAPEDRLAIGSVKTNIGHLESAAGIAGLIKVVLALEHEEIPPHLHLREPNPLISWDEIPVFVPTATTPWTRDGRRRLAGVSSFGFGGTNAHVILEEAPISEVKATEPERPLHILTLSARDEVALQELALRFEEHLATRVDIANIAFTANTGRSHLPHRLAVIGDSTARMRERLAATRAGGEPEGVFRGRVEDGPPEVVFLFTGQGSQAVGMGRQLYETQPTFRRTLDLCDDLLRTELERPLLSVLYPRPDEVPPIDETVYTQPALFALELALAELLRSWGIEPAAVMGHSIGEYVAGCVAGMLRLEDALRLVAERSRLMQSLPAGGAMAAVFADERRVAAAIAPHAAELSIAAVNGPAEMVASGDPGPLAAVLARLSAQGIEIRPLRVSHAFHSHLMDPILDAFEQAVSRLDLSPPRLPLISNLSGEPAGLEVTRADYWRRHAREPVRFAAGAKALHRLGFRTFLEVGPRPTLLGMTRRCLPEEGQLWLPTLRPGRDDWQQILQSLATLSVNGSRVDWRGFDRDYSRRRVALPTYPFQRRRYWIGGISESKPGPETDDLLYRLDWRRQDLAGPGASPTGPWLICADSGGIGQQLAARLQESGEVCVVAPEDGFESWSRPGVPPWRGIVLFSGEGEAAFQSCSSLLSLVQGLAECAPPPRVWIVTRGAHPPGWSPGQAALWGLGRVMALEHPELWGGLIDLDPADPDGDVERLWHELQHAGGEDQVAFRQGERRVARLVRDRSTNVRRPLAIRPDGTYLIAGGPGGLKRQAARWLQERGARHLILLRTGGGEGDDLGARVIEVDEALPPLQGILVLPESFEPLPLIDLDAKASASALRSTLTWLQSLGEGNDLDFFVLSSSIAAVWGSKGRGMEAAAGQICGALAQHCQSLGRPGLAIDWGPWMGEGEEHSGLVPMSPEQAVGALQALLERGAARAAVAGVDWARLKPALEARGRHPLLELIEVQHAPKPAAEAPELLLLLRGSPPAERRELLAAHIQKEAARILGLDRPLDSRQGFFEQGMDSLMAVELKRRLEVQLACTLPATLAFDRPNPAALASHLLQDVLALEEPVPVLRFAPQAADEPIAVIGMACRLPGGANDPAELWRLLSEGRDAICEVPAGRWDAQAFYDPEPDSPGKSYTRSGGFLDVDVEGFDAQFFGIAPREAARMDPQQRLLLELCWETLEHAGQSPDGLRGSRTGVFIGINTTDYSRLHRPLDPAISDAYFFTGNTFSVAAGRVSHALGLQGPSLALDTACSSALVSVHLACQSLRSGECRLALAGGVSLMLSPEGFVVLSRMRALAPGGRCRTFDAAADGYARGEGGGIVALKRLSEALADGDDVLALIHGSAVNHDGTSSGLTVPNGPAQQELIRQALANAGIDPLDVSYLEAHGTGTPLGDPIEMDAVRQVLCAGRPLDRKLVVGSVKTNIGHLEAAAGIAGLIKVILALRHGEIPRHLHFETPNPAMRWDELPVEIPLRSVPWPRGESARIAGVSSFGFSGTNAHVVLGEAPVSPPAPDGVERPLHLFTLSTRSEESLATLASRHALHLRAHPELPVADAAFTANTGRAHFNHRLAVMTADTDTLCERLTASAGVAQGQAASRPRIAFLFTGQGAQYTGMGSGLFETQPTFRRALERCQELLRPHLDIPLLEVIYPQPGNDSPLDQTLYTQPALFSLQYALVELWRSWGIEPDAVLGHSVGEIAAACTAGVLRLEDALRFVAQRARLIQQLPGNGIMATVFDSEESLQPLAEGVSVAAVNGPTHTVISGKRTAVEAVCATLQARGVLVRQLQVSHAFHSPLMEPILDDIERLASTVPHHPARLRWISALTADTADLSAGSAGHAAHWRRHLREPVRFSRAVEVLRDNAGEIFVEIGPSPTLLALGRRCLPEGTGLWLPSLRRGRDDWQQILETLAELYVHGRDVDWNGFDRDYHRRRVALPTYPFERQRHWLEPSLDAALWGGIGAAEDPIPGWVYELSWPSVEREEAPANGDGSNGSNGGNGAAHHGSWVIFADSSGIGERLAQTLEASGESCRVIHHDGSFDPTRPEHFDELLLQPGVPPCRGLIHLWSLEASAAGDQRLVCGSVLLLVQALIRSGISEPPRVWLLTRGAQAVVPGESASPAQASIWGLGRTLALEHPELWGGLVDLDPKQAPDAEDCGGLVEQILKPDHEDQLAFRTGRRHAARLTSGGSLTAAPLPMQADATYLITGGLGSLGLEITDWMVEQGARNLVLLGRSAPSERVQGLLDRIRERGARIVVVHADVSRQEDVDRVLEEVDRSLPPLRGVLHAAGVLDDGVLLMQDWSRFSSVMAPKVAGAWNLHLGTRDRQLDFFVLFSSAASLLGSPGQGNYAAANAFLDSLAHFRRAQGLPAVSICWGPWAEVGMAAELAERSSRQWTPEGVTPLQVDRGLEALGRLLGAAGAQVGVLPVDWSRFLTQLPPGHLPPLLAEVAQGAGGPVAPGEFALLAELEAAPAAERRERLVAHVQSQTAIVLGLKPGDLPDPEQGFFEMGLDSLMAIELKNRLAGTVGRTLPATIAFQHPTVAALAQHLLDEVLHLPDCDQEEDLAGAEDLDGSSEDELLAMLAEELSQLDERSNERSE